MGIIFCIVIKIYLKMKKTVKKPSTKIVVDEFDKYYRRDHEDRVKKSTYNQK